MIISTIQMLVKGAAPKTPDSEKGENRKNERRI